MNPPQCRSADSCWEPEATQASISNQVYLCVLWLKNSSNKNWHKRNSMGPVVEYPQSTCSLCKCCFCHLIWPIVNAECAKCIWIAFKMFWDVLRGKITLVELNILWLCPFVKYKVQYCLMFDLKVIKSIQIRLHLIFIIQWITLLITKMAMTFVFRISQDLKLIWSNHDSINIAMNVSLNSITWGVSSYQT